MTTQTTDQDAQGTGGCGGNCACGSGGGCGGGTARVPEMDARPIDPAIRQAAVLGVLVGLIPGTSARIVTDERPELVLMLVEQQFPDQYEVTVEQSADPSGVPVFRTKFARIA